MIPVSGSSIAHPSHAVQQPNPQDPGVVGLGVNTDYFLNRPKKTKAMRVTSITWGSPLSGKQALQNCSSWSLVKPQRVV